MSNKKRENKEVGRRRENQDLPGLTEREAQIIKLAGYQASQARAKQIVEQSLGKKSRNH